MVRLTIPLDTPVPESLAHAVLDTLAHASHHIKQLELDDVRAAVIATVDDESATPEVTAAVRTAVGAMIDGFREIEPVVMWRHETRPSHIAPPWDTLARAGLVREEAPGCVALLGDPCRVAIAVDAMFARLARDVFGAVPHQYPNLLAMSTLERCDYFASFPHHITFAPHVRDDLATIAQVSSGDKSTRATAIASALVPPTHVLSPSVCFHTYAAFADTVVESPRVVTAVNRCARWEATNFTTCERLWDFTMREVVFVGDPEWVEQQRELSIAQLERIVVELELDAWLEVASDPFFVGRFAAKRYYQLLRRAKYELRLTLPYSGGSVSAASFNVHEDFFGRSFGIRDARGEPLATGCWGAGIERWVWALYAQHGTEVAGWPATVRTRLGL